MRTCSTEFSLGDLRDELTHLTNDSVQQRGEHYGRHEPCNKLSYADLDKYLAGRKRGWSFEGEVKPRLREMAREVLLAHAARLGPGGLEHGFELLGLDFMLTEACQPLLIEVNTNPSLETCCPLLSRVIGGVVENVFRLCVDPLFPPPMPCPVTLRHFIPDHVLENMKFEMFFERRGKP